MTQFESSDRVGDSGGAEEQIIFFEIFKVKPFRSEFTLIHVCLHVRNSTANSDQ